MQWYRQKALAHILEESKRLLEEAKRQGREDKAQIAERMIDKYYSEISASRNIGQAIKKNNIAQILARAA